MQMLTPRMEDLPHKKFFGEAYISGVLPLLRETFTYYVNNVDFCI